MNINVGWFIAAFAAYFIINIVVSLRVSKGTSGISGFALGQVGPVVLAFSFFATRLSASVYLGEPGIMWTSGWPYSWIGILNAAFWTATIIIVARRMRTYSGALGALTVPDFLGQRYDSNFLRIWTCIGCTIFYILLIVSQYKGAIALFSTLFGMDKTVIIVAFSLFAIILVNIGGFKSVAWTDFLQGILMVIIAVVIFIAAFKAVGWSFADVNTQLSAIDPNLVQPFNESGLYSLSGVIAMPFYLFVSLVANPYCTIRLMAMTDVGRKSFKKFGLTLISVGMICMLMYMSGLFGRVLYPNLADADSVIPTIAQNLLPEWGLAIVAVGLFASMMACVDSMIHCISAMLSVDIYKRTLKKDATDQQVAKAARYITIAVVAIVLVITLFYTPKLLAMLGMIAGAGSGLVTLAPMLVGLYWERTTKAGAITGSLTGVLSFALFYFGGFFNGNLWIVGVAAAVLAVIVTVAVSLFTKPMDPAVLNRMKGLKAEG